MARKATKPPETAQQRLSAVHLSFFEELSSITNDSQQTMVDIQAKYQQALIDAWPTTIPMEAEAAAAARSAYEKASLAAAETLNQAMLEAQKEAMANNRYNAAYENYTGTMLKVLADLEPKSLDTGTMICLSQSFFEVAQAAASTMPPQSA